MAVYLCQVKNNSTIPVRVVIISMHGTWDFRMDAGETWAVSLQDGVKALLAWNTGTDELVVKMIIEVTGAALFRVFLSASAPVFDMGPLPPASATFTPVALPVQYLGEPLPPAGP
jgi:hypothetical protein